MHAGGVAVGRLRRNGFGHCLPFSKRWFVDPWCHPRAGWEYSRRPRSFCVHPRLCATPGSSGDLSLTAISPNERYHSMMPALSPGLDFTIDSGAGRFCWTPEPRFSSHPPYVYAWLLLRLSWYNECLTSWMVLLMLGVVSLWMNRGWWITWCHGEWVKLQAMVFLNWN